MASVVKMITAEIQDESSVGCLSSLRPSPSCLSSGRPALTHLAYWLPLGCCYGGPWWEPRGDRKQYGSAVLMAPIRRHPRQAAPLRTQQNLILPRFFQLSPHLFGYGAGNSETDISPPCLPASTTSVISCLVHDSSSNYWVRCFLLESWLI